jgi:hypothetical protein
MHEATVLTYIASGFDVFICIKHKNHMKCLQIELIYKK